MLLCALVLTACQLAADIVIVEQPTALTVELRRPGKEQPCIRYLAVYRAEDETNPLWQIMEAGDAPCALKVSYGGVPAGFEQLTRPTPLAAGARYRFAVLGSGINEATEFTPTRTVTPPSAAPAGSRSR